MSQSLDLTPIAVVFEESFVLSPVLFYLHFYLHEFLVSFFSVLASEKDIRDWMSSYLKENFLLQEIFYI